MYPPTAHASGVPPLPAAQIPEEEREAVFHILDLLHSLARYEQQFALALLLFNLTAGENESLARLVELGKLDFGTLDGKTNTLSGWLMMAARDGAMLAAAH